MTGRTQPSTYRTRWGAPAIVLATTAALLCLSPPASASAPPSASPSTSATCSWRGYFSETPGLTIQPAATPLKLFATGPLSGPSPRCHAQMTFRGEYHRGSTCQLFSFDGDVEGVPGVARFSTTLSSAIGPVSLLDANGKQVGIDVSNALPPENVLNPRFDAACFTRPGLKRARFSNIIVLY